MPVNCGLRSSASAPRLPRRKLVRAMSEFLFAHPSFLSGVARTLDLSGSFDAYNDSETPEEADARAARSDWMSTGRDMRNAMDEVEVERSQQSAR